MMDRCKCGYLAVAEIGGEQMCRGCAHVQPAKTKWLKNQQESLYSFEYILFDLGMAEFPNEWKEPNDFEFINACQTADFKKEQQK